VPGGGPSGPGDEGENYRMVGKAPVTGVAAEFELRFGVLGRGELPAHRGSSGSSGRTERVAWSCHASSESGGSALA